MGPRARFQVARLTESGPRPRRLLVVADRGAIEADPARPAADLPAALLTQPGPAVERRGMDLDLLWDMLPALRAIGSASASWRLWRYDAVVVVIDLAVPSLQTRRLQQLLQAALSDLADAGRLIAVLGSPPAEGQTSRRRLQRMRELLRVIDDHIPAVHATMTDGVLAEPRAVAAAVLAQLVPTEAGVPAAERRAAPQDESLRQVAVDRSLRAAQGGTTDLQRAVMLACNSFDVPIAQINLVNRGRLTSLAFIGRSSDGLSDTLSGLAVQGDGPLLVPDTRADRRFAAIPETHGQDAIRFYAGHPIESLDGYRIGVLCVLDTVPHEVLDGDDVLLRDVASLAEAELNALTAGPVPAGRRRAETS